MEKNGVQTEVQKSITIYQGYEFRTYIGDIYNENDFFYDQYCQAARCISEIVTESENYRREFGSSSQSYENKYSRMTRKQVLRGYPNNIIAFCARRGNGKTSAMLSMSKTLEKLPVSESEDDKRNFWEKVRNTPRNRYDPKDPGSEYKSRIRAEERSYLVMDAIDPANMEPNDSILLNILSRMYHMWEADINSSSRPERYGDERERNLIHELTKNFQKAYRNVYSLKSPLAGDELDEYDSLTRLSEKGDSVNTKNAFIDLVESFLTYFQKDMLVIQVDDADVNTTRAYEIVEDIRKYFVGPRILVILALHLDTLRNCIEQENVKRYQYLLDEQILIPHLQGSKCREMAERYIDKLIPGYHQIHLPYIDEWFRGEKTDVNLHYFLISRYSEFKDILKYDEYSSLNYQHRLFRLIYEKTGIILMPAKDYLHNFLPRRYRELSHFLSYFCDMEDIEVSGDGSLDILMKTCYGGKEYEESQKQKEYEESQKQIEKHWNLLRIRKENLEKMLVYFMQYWCPISLEKEQVKILQEIFSVPLKLKCQKTIDLLREYCERLQLNTLDTGSYLKSPVEFPDDDESVSYAQVIYVLHQLKKKLNVEHKFEFLYAIQLYYSICMNQSVCVHLERGEAFTEIAEMAGGAVFPFYSFYERDSDAENDFIYAEFLRRMLQNHQISPTMMGWDHLFKVVKLNENYHERAKRDGRKGIWTEKRDEDILIIKRDEREKDRGWVINPEIKWLAMDFNQMLFYLIENEWIFRHSRSELLHGNENAYEEVSFALQIICNFDFQNRIRKYSSYPVEIESDLKKQMESLCQNIEYLSSKENIEDDVESEYSIKEMRIKNPPAQDLYIPGDITGAVNELLGTTEEHIYPFILFMLTCASPKRSVFTFFEIVRETSEAIDARKDSDVVNWENIEESCQHVWDNHSHCLEYLSCIEAFQEYIEMCKKFIEGNRSLGLVRNITQGTAYHNEAELKELRVQTENYMKIRSTIIEESQKSDLSELVDNLKKCDWLTKAIEEC